MKRIFVLAMFFVGLSLHAQRYRPAKIIFKDSSSRNGLIENFLEKNVNFNPDGYKRYILFKETARSRREFLDTKKIDRIILFDKNMEPTAVFDFVWVKFFKYKIRKKKYVLSEKTTLKFLPLLFETEKFRVYKYVMITVNQNTGASGYTIIFIRNKNQDYGIPYELVEFNAMIVFPSSTLYSLLLQVRAMQELGKDCPAFLDYLKPFYQKYSTKERTQRKRIAKEYEQFVKTTFKSRKEYVLYQIMFYMEKYEELCGTNKQTPEQKQENSRNNQ